MNKRQVAQKLSPQHVAALKAATSGSSTSIPREVLIELFFEIGVSLADIGIKSFVATVCGDAHATNEVVAVEDEIFGTACSACASAFDTIHADLYGKTLSEMIAASSPALWSL